MKNMSSMNQMMNMRGGCIDKCENAAAANDCPVSGSIRRRLAEAAFAVHEAVLYLDTHPQDTAAMEYFERKKERYQQVKAQYEQSVGPLCAFETEINGGDWQWLDSPWPWEGEV